MTCINTLINLNIETINELIKLLVELIYNKLYIKNFNKYEPIYKNIFIETIENIQYIEDKIKNDNDPVFLHNIITQLKKNKITDEELSYIIRFYLKYNENKTIELNLMKKYKKKLLRYPLSYNIIKNYYIYIGNQYKLIPMLQEWKLMYSNPLFWQKDIISQIESLNTLKLKFLALFDGDKSFQLIHVKLLCIEYNSYHVEEMIDRLSQVYKLFKYNFFHKNNFNLLQLSEFIDLSFIDKVSYTRYTFNTINNILNKYITYFQLYESYRLQLVNLLNPNINISIQTVSSDVDSDDIDFILSAN